MAAGLACIGKSDGGKNGGFEYGWYLAVDRGLSGGVG